MTVALQFALVPNFSHLSFSDDALLQDALSHVLQVRNRQDPERRLADKISDQTGAVTVGDLRKLTDSDWKLLDLPAVCRIYLKNVVRQSARVTPGGPKSFMEQLQDDFNFGQPFDMVQYQEHISMLAAMGFNTEEAMEALVITENKGIEGALELLFQQDKSIRLKRRQEAMVRLNRQLVQPSHNGAEKEQKASSNAGELTSLRRQIENERQRRQKVEQEIASDRAAERLNLYKEFIRGITADETITTAAFEQFTLYRKEKKITDPEHEMVIKELGWTLAQFDGMKRFDQKDKKDSECVVCLDKPKDHVIMNCMHLCLCEDCAVDFSKPGAMCPLCSKKVRKVVRIFA